MGLTLTHHLTSALLVPAALAFVLYVGRSRLWRKRLLLKGAGLFAAGLLPYLYLPIRSLMEAPLNEADPSTPERFLTLVTGGSFLLKFLPDAEGSRGPGGLAAAGYDDLWAGGWQALQEVQAGIGIREGMLFGAGLLSSAAVWLPVHKVFLELRGPSLADGVRGLPLRPWRGGSGRATGRVRLTRPGAKLEVINRRQESKYSKRRY